ncbi:hypothetical protein ADK52_14020 [Streptomyces sp. WM6372]|nr:hypothetical protein ADK52_14020 [Streptomyces sp. WM6372]
MPFGLASQALAVLPSGRVGSRTLPPIPGITTTRCLAFIVPPMFPARLPVVPRPGVADGRRRGAAARVHLLIHAAMLHVPPVTLQPDGLLGLVAERTVDQAVAAVDTDDSVDLAPCPRLRPARRGCRCEGSGGREVAGGGA